MRKILGVMCGALLATAAASPLAAQSEHPFQVALMAPIQAFPEQDNIRGLRLSLLYGKNAGMTGLDVGLVNHTTREFLGVQFGIVGIAEGSFKGFQDNWLVNRVEGDFEGFQWGFVNSVDNGQGVQLSGVSHAQNFRGLQIGLVNYAETLDGVQVGLVNIIKRGGMFPVMVLVNWGKNSELLQN